MILSLLERHGWSGRWIKNWTGGREFCEGVGRPAPMPENAETVFTRIDQRAASRTGGGAWDVFAWRGDDHLFIESKQYRSSDALTPGQLAWLDAGLREGFDLAAFAVVEYDAPKIAEAPGAARQRSPRARLPSRAAAITGTIADRDPGLTALLDTAAQAPPSERILHRNPIAAYGDASIEPMVQWITEDKHASFAIRVLERLAAGGSSEAYAALQASRSSASTSSRSEIDEAVARIAPPRRPTIRKPSGSDVWRASPSGPPASTGPCGFLTQLGKPCENEGRYDRDGILSCSRHMKARHPIPWEGRT